MTDVFVEEILVIIKFNKCAEGLWILEGRLNFLSNIPLFNPKSKDCCIFCVES